MFGKRPGCDCEPGGRLCPEGQRLWQRASTAYNDGLRAQMRRGQAVDPSADAGADWPDYQRARAAYEAHLAAAQQARQGTG
jgi:hypothetical protein